MSEIRVAVYQDGARLHYAVPLAFKRSGMLAAFYTDWYNRQNLRSWLGINIAKMISPSDAARMKQRHSDELEGTPIFDHWFLYYFVHLGRKKGWLRRKVANYAHRFIQQSESESNNLLRDKIDMVYGFVYSFSQSIAEKIRSRDIALVLDQPLATGREAIAQQLGAQRRWPGWSEEVSIDEIQVYTLLSEMRVLPYADQITCASDYVKKSLVELQIEPERISVIPYPLDAASFPFVDRSGRSGPITVGIIGTVNLRKGAPVVLEIAKKFSPDKVRFVWVGISTLPSKRTQELGGYVELTGPVSRSQIPQWLGKFDIFLLASRAEGSAGSLMEAMASGLPVVTTTNSGTVARDGIEGYIREIDDIDGMTAVIEKLASNTELRLTMGKAARQRVLNFNIEWYGQCLTDLAVQLIEQRRK